MTKLVNKEAQLLKEIEQLRLELALAKSTQEAKTEQLFISEERFALAMRTANDGLWDWDLITDEVYYSPRWKSMLGYKEHELEGSISTWASLVHADDKDTVLQEVKQYLSSDTDNFEVEMRMQHKNGHEVYVRSRGFKVFRESSQEVVRLIGTHVDITSYKKAELFEQQHTRVLEMIAQGSSASNVYSEIALMYEERHPGMRCSMLELSGNKLLHGGAPSLPKAYCDAVHGLINGPNIGSCGTSTYTGKRVLVENIETDPKWKNLKDVALPFGMRSCWSEPIKSSSGKVLGAFGMYYNYPALPDDEELNSLISAARLASIVMEREQNQKKIRDLAYTDKLTNLSSRSHFYLNTEELIKISARDKIRFGLLYVDLDNFKHVNDSLGHDVGDYLLKEIALRLRKACREVDYIARLGGDEFCIAVSDIKGDYGTAYVAQRCLELISKPFELCGRIFTPGCSIGIAHYPDDGEDLKTLLKAADTALYTAKDNGKNRYAFYKKELTLKTEYRFKIEQYLREAIEQEQLFLVYQPKIDLASGKIISVEALCRWSHPVLGKVEPANFIRMAEEIGMIKPLTEWVLGQACRQMNIWKQLGLTSVRMAVNISPSLFLDSDLVPLVENALTQSKIEAKCLELEVTEGEVQTNQDNLSVFEHLKALGIYLAIDDFGIGYSSFASLKHLNVDFLKIDKHFISDMLTDEKTKLLVGSMIEMGHNLGHIITAEGIENHKQLQILKELGCDNAQGYLFSPPLESTQILAFLSNENPLVH